MSNFFKDNEDLAYYFDRGIDWEPLVRLAEYDYRSEGGFKNAPEAVEVYRQIVEMVGELVATEVAPYAAAIDHASVSLKDGEAVHPPELDAIFDKFRELELFGMTLPRELGGMNCPMVLYFITSEIIARGDVSVMGHFGFHGGMAMAMLLFSLTEGSSVLDKERAVLTKTRFEEFIGEIVRGEAWGSMDITEPDAGSDMARLKAVGEQLEDGSWVVTGQKIFITSGHAKYHFVIARTEQASDPNDPMAGLAGLSMFLVPTYETDAEGNRKRIVVMDRIEEKLGHHGSVTASLAFDHAPAHLIGKRGEGFKHMLTLMNNARLGVGFESLGLCEAAYRLARDYAAERPSMGKTIDKHEMIADYLDEMRTDVQAIRAIAMRGAEAEEKSQKLKLARKLGLSRGELSDRRDERDEKRYATDARRVTPLLKYFASEKAVEMGRRALQIHGGNGYMKDYGAEKLLRDALVMPIYEGTSQIQSLMATKDTLSGIMKNPQAFMKKRAQAGFRQLSAKDALERRVAKISLLSMGAQSHLIAKTAADKIASLQEKPLATWPDAIRKNWDPKRDFAYAMLHAERLTRLLADELIAETLLSQAKRDPERRELLERFLDRCEPRCRFLHDEITTTGARLLRKLGRDTSVEETSRAAG